MSAVLLVVLFSLETCRSKKNGSQIMVIMRNSNKRYVIILKNLKSMQDIHTVSDHWIECNARSTLEEKV